MITSSLQILWLVEFGARTVVFRHYWSHRLLGVSDDYDLFELACVNIYMFCIQLICMTTRLICLIFCFVMLDNSISAVSFDNSLVVALSNLGG